MAPNYANIFMDRFETKALNHYHQKPLVWKRFIDDIFMIWTHGEESLKEFIKEFSPKNPHIVKLIRYNWNIIQNTEELFGLSTDAYLI